MDLHLSELDQHFTMPKTRTVGMDRPLAWLKMGMNDLMQHPGPSLTYGFIITVVGWILLSVADPKGHFFATLVTGFLLLSPLAAAGIYELTSEREEGRPTSFMQSIHDLSKNLSQIAFLGVILGMVAMAWERVSAILFALLYGGQVPANESVISALTGEYLNFTLIWAAAGFVLACFVFALTAVSIPMLADREVDSVTAMMTSLRAVAENISTMLVWAALIVGLTAIGFATYLVGLIVIFPLLGHATWYAYKEMIE
ncbi:DUF2189 domain-containing protein [Chitinibacter bivalviorum]|uniref:DUF2189 domain-containing protein n=1 Tax=Chitinibacter bivalviorum TaxID=2739434 RepID=A0A7H9BKR1_9NEIS|nr:DUF2189 domain-containing protein [Chitinibacter bivalviorum]QLG89265.1 DUF2189 domain-containing protein [Chitinibacter bivalviorum]